MEEALCIYDPQVRWLLVIAAAIMSVVIYWSVRVGLSSLRLRLRGNRTCGKVIVVSRRSGGESGPEFLPWIRFKTNETRLAGRDGMWPAAVEIDGVGCAA